MRSPDDADRRALVRQEIVTVMGLRLSGFATFGLLALAMLAVAIGAGIAALRTSPADTVMLFIATTMALVGIVAAVGAVISARGLRRDPVDSVTVARPRRSRLPRNLPGGIALFLVAVVVGVVLALLLARESVAMAGGVLIACVLIGLIGPASAAAFTRSQAELATQLAEQPALRERIDDLVPLWVHDALQQQETEARQEEQRKERFARRIAPDEET